MIYSLIEVARLRTVRNAEKMKWDTSGDRVDHMAAGDYRRVWLLLRERPVDYCEQSANEDVMEAKTLPYAMIVDDDTPHLFDPTEHPDSDRCILMEQLADLMKECLPSMGKGRGASVRV